MPHFRIFCPFFLIHPVLRIHLPETKCIWKSYRVTLCPVLCKISSHSSSVNFPSLSVSATRKASSRSPPPVFFFSFDFLACNAKNPPLIFEAILFYLIFVRKIRAKSELFGKTYPPFSFTKKSPTEEEMRSEISKEGFYKGRRFFGHAQWSFGDNFFSFG